MVAAKLDRMFRPALDCLAVVEAFKARGESVLLLDLNGRSRRCSLLAAKRGRPCRANPYDSRQLLRLRQALLRRGK